MSCGCCHSLVLTLEGEAYGWGHNGFGQIGKSKSDNNNYQLIPYFINEFDGEKVKSISYGNLHSLALTESGSVYSWGSNSWGQLGRNSSKDNSLNCPKLVELNEGLRK